MAGRAARGIVGVGIEGHGVPLSMCSVSGVRETGSARTCVQVAVHAQPVVPELTVSTGRARSGPRTGTSAATSSSVSWPVETNAINPAPRALAWRGLSSCSIGRPSTSAMIDAHRSDWAPPPTKRMLSNGVPSAARPRRRATASASRCLPACARARSARRGARAKCRGTRRGAVGRGAGGMGAEHPRQEHHAAATRSATRRRAATPARRSSAGGPSARSLPVASLSAASNDLAPESGLRPRRSSDPRGRSAW